LRSHAEVVGLKPLRIEAFIIEAAKAQHGATGIDCTSSVSLLVKVKFLVRHDRAIPMIIIVQLTP
jgi:hypothetical protein